MVLVLTTQRYNIYDSIQYLLYTIYFGETAQPVGLLTFNTFLMTRMELTRPLPEEANWMKPSVMTTSILTKSIIILLIEQNMNIEHTIPSLYNIQT